MSTRAISPTALAQMFAQESAHTFHVLAVFSHASFATVRIANNTLSDIVFEANTYIALNFEANLGVDEENDTSPIDLSVDNTSLDLVDMLRSVQTRIDVALSLIRIDTAGTITREIGPVNYKVLGSKIDTEITLTMGIEADILNAAATQDRFTPSVAPGLF